MKKMLKKRKKTSYRRISSSHATTKNPLQLKLNQIKETKITNLTRLYSYLCNDDMNFYSLIEKPKQKRWNTNECNGFEREKNIKHIAQTPIFWQSMIVRLFKFLYKIPLLSTTSTPRQ